MTSTIDTIYTGASDFGKFTALISAIVGTIIALLAIGIGIYLIVEETRRTQTVQGTIESVQCSPANCLIQVTYQVQGRNFTKDFSVESSSSLQQGNTVTLLVDPNNPQDNVILEIGNSNNQAALIAGGVLIGVGLLILIIVWLIYYFATKSKFFAAAEGVGEAANIISSV